MPEKLKRTDKAEPKVLRERAIRCLRLALGAGDLKLSKILTSLAQEYEARADQLEAKEVSPRWSEASKAPADLSALDQPWATNEKMHAVLFAEASCGRGDNAWPTNPGSRF